MTDHTYAYRNPEGMNISINKDDLDNVTCLHNHKNKLEKNMEDNEQSLKNILKSEIMKENKIRKIRKEINQKEEKYNEFINERKEGIKFLENERYKYLKDREERTKLYNKMMINFGHRINLSNIINKGNNGKIKPNSKDKAEELKEQIDNYEKKNDKYKKRISEIFDLDESNKIRTSLPKINESKVPDERQKKLMELEDRFEMDLIKRENVFLNHLNIMQNKINDYMEKQEKKDNRIKQSIERRNKLREEKRLFQDLRMDEIKEKLVNRKIDIEQKRIQKLENIELKNLKNYAIKQEKLKIFEERKRLARQNSEEKEAVKLKLQKIINRQKNYNKIKYKYFHYNIYYIKIRNEKYKYYHLIYHSLYIILLIKFSSSFILL